MEAFPAFYPQRRLWFLNQLDSGSTAYNIAARFRIRGPADPGLVERTVAAIVARHESLRTTFTAHNGEPVQVVHPEMATPFEVLDLRTVPESKRDAESIAAAQREARTPFDLQSGPLLRTTLLRLGDEAWLLLLTIHHIVADGWSIGVIMREFAQIYPALAANEKIPLEPLEWQYVDYTLAEMERVSSPAMQDNYRYFQEKLGGAPLVTTLPADRPRPEQSTSGSRIHSVLLPRRVFEAIEVFSRQRGATLFMTMLAAYKILLYRYTGQRDLVVGAPIANRTRPETEPLAGFFVNMLPLRTTLDPRQSFEEVLAEVRATVMEGFARQDTPIEKIVETLRPARARNLNPFFQTIFYYHKDFVKPMGFCGLNVTSLPSETPGSMYDLNIYVIERAEGLRVNVDYDTDLFDHGTIERVVANYLTLLQAILDDPSRTVAELPVVSAAERKLVTGDWNATEAPVPDMTVHDWISKELRQRSNAHAVQYGNRRITCGELDLRSNQLAHYLRRAGVGPESRVGLLLDRSETLLTGLLGILKAGGAYVPLDPDLPADRIAYILRDAGALIVVVSSETAGKAPAGLAVVSLCRDGNRIEKEPATSCPSSAGPNNLCQVIYTSGSTGRPKGVLIEHRSVVSLLAAMLREHRLTAHDRVLATTTISFDIAAMELLLPLAAGACVVLMPKRSAGDGALIQKALRETGATVLQATPTAWRILLEGGWRGGEALRAISGGEALSADLARQIRERTSALWNGYGPTETTIYSIGFHVGPEQGAPVPVGRPVANTRLYILDEFLNPVPIGVAGDLYIAGAGVARGYTDPELTRERFLPELGRTDGARMYFTGDRARYRADGLVDYLGRSDDQVKIHGYRIEPGEIEATLRLHARVREVVVVAREDRPGDVRLAAYVVSDNTVPNANLEVELRALARRKLPDYMMPAAFVFLPRLPLTHNNKIDRKALPRPDSGGHAHQPATPRTSTERALLPIWQQVLDNRELGVRDNFFEAGGHSLMAVRLFSELRHRFGKQLPLATLFSAPTVEQLAGVLDADGWQAPWDCLVPIQPQGSRPPFFCVHGVGGNVIEYFHMAKYLGLEQPFYGIQAAAMYRRERLIERVEEIAAHYIQQLITFQPNGPYYLGGSSFGGLVAYEMGRQLAALNREVALVALFDTFGPGYPQRLPGNVGWRRSWNRLHFRLHLHLGNLRRGTDRTAYVQDKAQRFRRILRRSWKKLVNRWRSRLQARIPSELKAVERAGLAARREYDPQPWDGPVVLFRAAQQPFGIVPDATNGWGPLVPGLQVREIPGHHGAMVKDPQVRDLVPVLTSILREIQDQRKTSARDAVAPQSLSI
ncbi:MAG: amino acid adenylation domain-containing protein [Bryobacteraceae bacterium]|nr:amino acid adenylation domain-containing protein [Bryobacteraceae bacterium]